MKKNHMKAYAHENLLGMCAHGNNSTHTITPRCLPVASQARGWATESIRESIDDASEAHMYRQGVCVCLDEPRASIGFSSFSSLKPLLSCFAFNRALRF